MKVIGLLLVLTFFGGCATTPARPIVPPMPFSVDGLTPDQFVTELGRHVVRTTGGHNPSDYRFETIAPPPGHPPPDGRKAPRHIVLNRNYVREAMKYYRPPADTAARTFEPMAITTTFWIVYFVATDVVLTDVEKSTNRPSHMETSVRIGKLTLQCWHALGWNCALFEPGFKGAPPGDWSEARKLCPF